MNTIGKNIYTELKPLPENLQGWNSNHSIFETLIKKTNPQTIIEIGTWKGASAINMAKICKGLELDTKIYCVDTWLGSVEFWNDLSETPERDLMLKNGYPQIYYQFLSNIIHHNLQDVIIPVPNTSANAAKILSYHNIKADLIYIDASHEYEDVKADIKAYLPLLNKGGVMFGDDYGWPGVRKAVDEGLGKVKVFDLNYWTTL